MSKRSELDSLREAIGGSSYSSAFGGFVWPATGIYALIEELYEHLGVERVTTPKQSKLIKKK